MSSKKKTKVLKRGTFFKNKILKQVNIEKMSVDNYSNLFKT